MKLKIIFASTLIICFVSFSACVNHTQAISTISAKAGTFTPTSKPQETATPSISPLATDNPYPTRAPIPVDLYQANSRFVTEPDLAIAYSSNFLLLRDYTVSSFETGLYSPIEFPDGSKGAFVALGASGPTEGYRIVYRIEGSGFQIIQLWHDDYLWGETWTVGEPPGNPKTKVGLEFPELLINREKQNVPLIQVTGVSHMGVGLIDDGYFEILRITDEGVKVIFSGSKLIGAYVHMGKENSYDYRYEDLNGDGNKEIIKDGQECNVIQNQDYTWKRINCKTIHEIHKYNGEEYVK